MSNRTEISTLGEFGLIRHLTDRIEIKNNSTIKKTFGTAHYSWWRTKDFDVSQAKVI